MDVKNILKASDNTGKISIKLEDGSIIESVLLIDQSNRVTACLSSQVGCAQNCSFCKTGTLGLKRNLTSDEIIKQFDLLEASFNREITNIVYMGMGEPLHNIKNVMKSIRVFTNPQKYNIFLRRITLSTSGVIRGIPEILKEAPYPGLAFSLITADEKLRKDLVPNTPELDKIKQALLEYQQISNKRIIIEIIIFSGINETTEEADKIYHYLKGMDVIINLIPFNDIGDSRFQEPDMNKVLEFSKFLFNHGLKVTIRHSKGQDIAGACGQLGYMS